MVLFLFLLQSIFSGDSFECIIYIFIKMLHVKFFLGSKLFVSPVTITEQVRKKKNEMKRKIGNISNHQGSKSETDLREGPSVSYRDEEKNSFNCLKFYQIIKWVCVCNFLLWQNTHSIKFIILTRFKCSSVELSRFALLWNHHHHHFIGQFSHPKWDCVPFKQ